MESWQAKYPIYRLIDEGYANASTVARLINASDATALRKYLSACYEKRFRDMVDAEMADNFAYQVEMCRRWIDEAYEQSNNDKEATRKRIAKLKTFAEDFELTKAMRQAWRQKFKV